jgi:hypothetical protein
MYFYIHLERGKVNLTDVYNAGVNYDNVMHKKIRKKKQITFHIKSFALE